MADQALGLSAKGSNAPLQRDAAMVAARAALAGGDPTKALDRAQTALQRARAEALDPASSSAIGEALLLRAQAHVQRGEASVAVPVARDALSHLQENLGATHALTRQARELARADAS